MNLVTLRQILSHFGKFVRKGDYPLDLNSAGVLVKLFLNMSISKIEQNSLTKNPIKTGECGHIYSRGEYRGKTCGEDVFNGREWCSKHNEYHPE